METPKYFIELCHRQAQEEAPSEPIQNYIDQMSNYELIEFLARIAIAYDGE